MTYKDIFEETSFENQKADMKKQLEIGKKIEKEHNPTYLFLEDYVEKHGKLPPKEEFYQSIAEDHLKENNAYYTYLKKMEKQFEE